MYIVLQISVDILLFLWGSFGCIFLSSKNIIEAKSHEEKKGPGFPALGGHCTFNGGAARVGWTCTWAERQPTILLASTS